MKQNLLRTFLLACITLTVAFGLDNTRGASVRQQPARREIAVTFDDLPSTQGDLDRMRYVITKLTEITRANRVPAIGFVNESKLFVPGEIDERTALLQQWLDAGLDLGNHSFSHIQIDNVPFEVYKEDLIRGETVTRMLLREKGKTLKY